jgi:predicted AAA+ superfamily ATPase
MIAVIIRRKMTATYSRILKLPRTSFFLLGPRGTGKTTWVRQVLPRAKVFDLLDESLYQSYLADPALFSRELNAIRRGSWVVVDEVQRLPALLNEVHRAIEAGGLRFVLTASSARKLRQGGVNLLAGRALRRLMFPLTPEELGRDFDLERALSIGTLPLVWTHPSPEEALGAYTQLYLKEEIQAEAIVRNLAGFARFLPIAALFHGQVLNVSNVARDAAVSRTTVNGYLEVLEDTLLAYRVPAFEGRLRVRERKHPKLYWIDPGIVRSLKNARGPVTQEEMGPLLEGYVLMLLKAHRSARGLVDEISYWAPAEARSTEVDFLLVEGKRKTALEVKASTKLREEHFRGLRAIQGLPGLDRRILVYLGGTSQRTGDGIEVWPMERLWRSLAKRA